MAVPTATKYHVQNGTIKYGYTGDFRVFPELAVLTPQAPVFLSGAKRSSKLSALFPASWTRQGPVPITGAL